MKSVRSFFGLLLGVIALISFIEAAVTLGNHDNVIGTIEAMLGLVAASIALGAAYIGSVLDDNFDRIAPPRPKAQPVQPPTQGYPQQ